MKTVKYQENVSEYERNNRMGMRAHFIMIIIVEVFALVQFLAGQSSAFYLVGSLIIGFFSPAMEYYFWKKDHETTMIKHFVGYGFAVYYTFILFNATNNMVFGFVLPMLIIITIFNDTAYTLKINIGAVMESVIACTLGCKLGGKFGYRDINTAVIQIAVMIAVAAYSYFAAKTINQNTVQKLDKIKGMMDHTENGIQTVYSDLEELRRSTESTSRAMDQVSGGTSDTAVAVQKQMQQTQAIGDKTTLVENATRQMNESLSHTMGCVEKGKDDLGGLIEAVDNTVSTSQEMEAMLTQLHNNMQDMENASKMIEDIAFQTNILALNANVEAARAGEAGRGFAVVATQVSAMSVKTKEVTGSIGDMITAVTHSLEEITDQIHRMTDEIEDEKQKAAKAEDSFADIQANTMAVSESVSSLLTELQDLTMANHGIMDSIQTISAASEEVSALAVEARSQEDNNYEILNHISDEMQKLVQE